MQFASKVGDTLGVSPTLHATEVSMASNALLLGETMQENGKGSAKLISRAYAYNPGGVIGPSTGRRLNEAAAAAEGFLPSGGKVRGDRL